MVKDSNFNSKLNLFPDLNVVSLFPRSYTREVFLCHDGTDGLEGKKVNKNTLGPMD